MHRLLALICLLLVTAIQAEPHPPRTFNEAKKIAWDLYAQQSVKFYCDCRYQGNRGDLASCGYQPRKQLQRAARIEWEHTANTGEPHINVVIIAKPKFLTGL